MIDMRARTTSVACRAATTTGASATAPTLGRCEDRLHRSRRQKMGRAGLQGPHEVIEDEQSVKEPGQWQTGWQPKQAYPGDRGCRVPGQLPVRAAAGPRRRGAV